MSMSQTEDDRRVPLTPAERRVLGALIEKQKTTPDAYPMTLNGLVTACNQKSARDPITNFDVDDVEDVLGSLRRKGAAILYEGSGRVDKYKHLAYDWLGLKGQAVAMAVMAELLLRGPQTEGDLRARANRMDRIADIDALHAVLDLLAEKDLIVYLTPEGQRRGVVVTHNLYPPDELERVRRDFARSPLAAAAAAEGQPAAPRASSGSGAGAAALQAEIESLREQVAALTERIETLESDIAALKTALGA
jgi:uncharacterized protein YceH (UPF0502 family)